jgi:predicted amidohydrolase
MKKLKSLAQLDRRELLARAMAATASAGVLGAAAGSAEVASAQAAGRAAPAGAAAAGAPGATTVAASKRGQYASVPLRQDAINVSAIQSRLLSIDHKKRDADMKRNLAHVTKLIDYAQGSGEEWGGERLWGAKQDLICMHEFPIQGFQPWTRDQLNAIAMELPGPEADVIAQRAKRYGCYISFGCYAKLKDWPRHVINMSVIVGPQGNIVSQQWKARNILGLFGEGALIGTTVYDVLDRYVEMYGWDATIPITRTDIGNIAVTAVGGEPIMYMAMAMKGAEIVVLSVTGGTNAEGAIQTARNCRTYVVGVGNSVSPDNIGWVEGAGGRDEGTVVVDPRGTVLARTPNHHEEIASARIPIADFRKGRRTPEFPMALLLPVFQQYEPLFKPGAFLEKLPETYKESGDLVRARMGMK